MLVLPDSIRATVTTTGSNTEMRRVTMACTAVTNSQATGIGSTVSCGAEAWPPRPLKVIRKRSAAANSGPARPANWPVGMLG